MDWLEKVKDARQKGLFESAMSILESELTLRPLDPQIHFQIAWTHDALGKESDAAPAYERAIELGLSGDDLRSALLGLGSTYRCLGEYDKSMNVLSRGVSLFPDYRALEVFRCLTLYNLGQADKAIGSLLRQLIDTSTDESIKRYARALTFYSDKLNNVFE